jgi:hypothetical protein
VKEVAWSVNIFDMNSWVSGMIETTLAPWDAISFSAWRSAESSIASYSHQWPRLKLMTGPGYRFSGGTFLYR